MASLVKIDREKGILVYNGYGSNIKIKLNTITAVQFDKDERFSFTIFYIYTTGGSFTVKVDTPVDSAALWGVLNK